VVLDEVVTPDPPAMPKRAFRSAMASFAHSFMSDELNCCLCSPGKSVSQWGIFLRAPSDICVPDKSTMSLKTFLNSAVVYEGPNDP